MNSLISHWDDRNFRNTVLLFGIEEGSFYEPQAKLDIRCFVVVTIRNSPIETIQSESYSDAGMVNMLTSKEVKEITSEAIKYFSKQNFDKMCVRAKSSQKKDLYYEIATEHPVSWAALQQLSSLNSKTIDYPMLCVSEPYQIEEIKTTSETTISAGEFKGSVYDGYSPEIEAPLKEYLNAFSTEEKSTLIADSFKSITRNINKLFDIMEFLLTRGHSVASANFYIENGHVERRIKPLRAGHTTTDYLKNISNTSGLGYKHKSVLNDYTKQMRSK